MDLTNDLCRSVVLPSTRTSAAQSTSLNAREATTSRPDMTVEQARIVKLFLSKTADR